MENFRTTFKFEDGKLFDYDRYMEDRGVLLIMQEIETVLRPAIEQNKLSGEIALTIFDDHVRIEYINIVPNEFTAILKELIIQSDSGDHFSKN
jgi:hypothetical protein